MADTKAAGRARHAITIPDPDRPLKRNEQGEIIQAGARRTYQFGEIVNLTEDQAKDPVIIAALMSEAENKAYEAKLAAAGVTDTSTGTDEPGLNGERADHYDGSGTSQSNGVVQTGNGPTATGPGSEGAGGGLSEGGTGPDGKPSQTGSSGSSQAGTATNAEKSAGGTTTAKSGEKAKDGSSPF